MCSCPKILLELRAGGRQKNLGLSGGSGGAPCFWVYGFLDPPWAELEWVTRQCHKESFLQDGDRDPGEVRRSSGRWNTQDTDSGGGE